MTTGAPGSETLTGDFTVQSKLPSAYSSAYGIEMPFRLGIYRVGHLENGIHAMPPDASGAASWDQALGRPTAPGCVILGYAAAQQLWAWAEAGTPVLIWP